jgi:hypothetical protein
MQMNKQNRSMVISAALLIVFAALTRLLPHPFNFTAVGAMAVFGGSVIKDKKLAFLLPLAALLLSDVCLQLFSSTKGFYGTTQFFVYGAFMLITLLSTFIRKTSVANIAFAAVWSGLIFFIISNLGAWISSTTYAHNLNGLLVCYAAAIPFYKNEFFGNFLLNGIMGNVFFSALLFGGYYLMARNIKVERAIA